MARPKGSGVIKFIDPTKQDFVAIRNSLHAGKVLPLSDQRAWLLFRWQELNALHDDCAKRLEAEGNKRKRKLLTKHMRALGKAIDETWGELGVAWRGLSGEQFQTVLAEASQHLQHASQPPVFGWRQEATRQVEIAYLCDGEDDKPSSPKGATLKFTAKQLDDQIRANGYSDFTIHDLRRFVRDTMQVTLRDERGTKHDLKRNML